MAVGEAERSVRKGQKRQTQDDRSAATREKLINGAYRVLLQVGHAGLRSANISAAAEVSCGGLLHHYPTKEMLIAAVYERIVNRMESESQDRIASATDEGVLAAIVADARQRFFSDAYRVMLDILIASGEEAPLAKLLNTLQRRKGAPAHLAWADRLARTGVQRELATQVASFLWYLVKGLAVRGFLHQNKAHDRRVISLGLDLAAKRIAASTLLHSGREGITR